MKKVGVIITPLARALRSSASTRALRAPAALLGLLGLLRQAEVVGDGAQVVLGQRLRARHQLDVRVPELLRIVGALHQLGGAARDVAAGERPMPEDVAQPIAELVAHLGDALVGRAAMRAGVAAVFDQRDLGVLGAEDVVVGVIDRAIEPIHFGNFGHPRSALSSPPAPRQPARRLDYRGAGREEKNTKAQLRAALPRAAGPRSKRVHKCLKNRA